MSITNVHLSGYSFAAGTQYTAEVEIDPFTEVAFDVVLERVIGSPSGGGGVTAVFQFSPLNYNGNNLASGAATIQRQWLDITAADGFMGSCLPDGDWPASLGDYSLGSTQRQITRRFRASANGCLIRLAITVAAFSGGTSPKHIVTVISAQKNQESGSPVNVSGRDWLRRSGSRGQTVFEDSYESGPRGWCQLYTPAVVASDGLSGGLSLYANGTGGTVSWITRGARPRVHLRTPAVNAVSGMMLKRVGNGLGDGKYLLEMELSLDETWMSFNCPRFVSIGLDVALNDGARSFFALRYMRYDETGGSATHTWQLAKNGGTYHDLGNYQWRANENKGLPLYVALAVDTRTGLYDGVNVANTIKDGTLASPQTSLAAVGQSQQSALVNFSGGINTFIELTNRTSGTPSVNGCVNVFWSRLTYVGG